MKHIASKVSDSVHVGYRIPCDLSLSANATDHGAATKDFPLQDRWLRRSRASDGSPLRVTTQDAGRQLDVYVRRQELRANRHRTVPKSRGAFDEFRQARDQPLSVSGSLPTISSGVQITGTGIERSLRTR